MATTYATLDHALQEIAERSFLEDAIVTPVEGGWSVEDDTTHATDDWTWTYADGIHDGESVSEHSRLFDHYESFYSSSHIRSNLPDMVALLEGRSHSVSFAYAVVRDLDVEIDPDTGNPINLEEDEIAGWIMVALSWELEE